jgi:hypothetical protein
MPSDLAQSTVYDYLAATDVMRGELRRQCPIVAGRKPEPIAAIIDSRSVKAVETAAQHAVAARPGRRSRPTVAPVRRLPRHHPALARRNS